MGLSKLMKDRSKDVFFLFFFFFSFCFLQFLRVRNDSSKSLRQTTSPAIVGMQNGFMALSDDTGFSSKFVIIMIAKLNILDYIAAIVGISLSTCNLYAIL